MKKDKLVEKIKTITDKYGSDAFAEENLFYSLLTDIAPELIEERKVIKRAKDEKLLNRLLELRNVKDTEISDRINELKNMLKAAYGFSDEWVDLLVNSFAEAFNIVPNCSPKITNCSFNIEDKKIIKGYGEIDSVTSKRFETYCLQTLNNRYGALYIGAGYTMIGKNAFSNRDDIEIILIGNGVSHIKKGAFKNCKNLKYVVGGENLISVASDVFSECENLCAIYLDQGAFMSFSDLFPRPEIQFDDRAFSNCNSLQIIACKGKYDVDSVKNFCTKRRIKFEDFEDMSEDSNIRKELSFSFVDLIKIERIIVKK